MTLYLHCGYHKTASSYLQSCFASKKALLAKHGIFYPDDPRQVDSARGIPTAGNGAELAQALLALNSRRALEMLQDYARHARCMGLGAVLLSTEGFFSSFAREESLAMFANLALQSGFQNVNSILFFRDPVEHAISVYCHRAASGKVPGFEEWIETRFETPALMRSFARHCWSAPIKWQFERFQPKIEKIETVAFVRWLGITEAIEFSNLPVQVNVSINVDECELVRAFQARHPGCGRYISDAIKALCRGRQDEASFLRQDHELIAAAFFKRHLDVLDAVNRLLPVNQKLVLTERSRTISLSSASLFTIEQSVACAQGLLDFRKSRTLRSRFSRFIRRAWLKCKGCF